MNRLIKDGYSVEVTGHSLGSFYARTIIEDFPNKVDRAVLFAEPKQIFFDTSKEAMLKEKIVRVQGDRDIIGRGDIVPDLTLPYEGHALPELRDYAYSEDTL